MTNVCRCCFETIYRTNTHLSYLFIHDDVCYDLCMIRDASCPSLVMPGSY